MTDETVADMRKKNAELIKNRNVFLSPVLVIASVVVLLAVCSCKKDEPPVIPVVETTNISGITQTTASGGGKVVDNGGLPIISRGVCWGFSDNPTILDRKTSDGKGDGLFTSNLTDLSPQSQYYVRAYATNSIGTGYGESVTFNTSPVGLCEVTTAEVTERTSNSAKSGGNVISGGGGSVTGRGVCWSTKTGPVITGNDNKTSDYSGTGTFVSNITGLQPNQTYYVRAYATNMAGVAYGNEREFKTLPAPPSVITKEVTNRSYRSATAGGEVISDGGSPVTGRGICYATHTDPVISENKTPSGAGVGSFTVNLTSLTPNTQYYVRAYAITAYDTAYGSSVPFSTLPLAAPVVSTALIISFTGITADVGGEVTADGGDAVTDRGVCWGTELNPSLLTDKHASSGSGIGKFSLTIDGLNEGTTYHVRAYATNSVGTAYGQDESFTTTSTIVTDGDGNSYTVVQIGTQYWLASNLRTTKFNDGSAIPLVTNGTTWAALTTPGYCWYNNDAAGNGVTYGALYNWYAVSTTANGGKNVCPVGWHVPTDTELTTLTTYLGGLTIAGGALKETGTTHWTSPNTGATNSSGFTALPGGYRTTSFNYLGQRGYWWSSAESSSNNGIYRSLVYNQATVTTGNTAKSRGHSVRCLKD